MDREIRRDREGVGHRHVYSDKYRRQTAKELERESKKKMRDRETERKRERE